MGIARFGAQMPAWGKSKEGNKARLLQIREWSSLAIASICQVVWDNLVNMRRLALPQGSGAYISYFLSSFYALDASAVLKSRSLGLTGSIDDATTKEKMRHGIVGHSAGQTSQKSHSA